MKGLKSITMLAGFLGALAPALASAVSIPFVASLDGAQEVPPRVTTGTGSATGLLTGDAGSYVFNYTVNYSGLTSMIASPYAHIHNGVFGMNGPIVHDLDGANVAPIAGSTSGTITGDWRFDDAKPLTDTLATALLAGNTYFNIHTTMFPGGEIRGQLSPVPEPSSVLLMVLGVAALGFAVRKRQTAAV